MSYISKIRELETLMTKAIQDTIKSKGLVKTGKLLNSVVTQAQINSDGSFNLKVSAEDYYDDLDNKYNITNDTMNGPLGEQINDLIEEVYFEYLNEKINKIK